MDAGADNDYTRRPTGLEEEFRLARALNRGEDRSRLVAIAAGETNEDVGVTCVAPHSRVHDYLPSTRCIGALRSGDRVRAFGSSRNLRPLGEGRPSRSPSVLSMILGRPACRPSTTTPNGGQRRRRAPCSRLRIVVGVTPASTLPGHRRADSTSARRTAQSQHNSNRHESLPE